VQRSKENDLAKPENRDQSRKLSNKEGRCLEVLMAKFRLSHHALLRFMEYAHAFDFSELRTYAAVWLGRPSANRVEDGELVRFVEETIDLAEFKAAFYQAFNGAAVLRETKTDTYRLLNNGLVAVVDKDKPVVKTILPKDFLLRKARPWNLGPEKLALADGADLPAEIAA
jgi:arsenate reductase-like glutaredoxin family protein